jgi:predicted metal-dependent phosphoesterase TrpH
MPKYIDLHTHSNYSDGTFTPREIIHHAKELGITAIALTDHDCVDGLDEFIQAGNEYGIETIPGVELSCDIKPVKIHILGYQIDYNDHRFRSVLQELNNKRFRRNELIVEALASNGIYVNLSEVAQNGSQVITRAHFAHVLYRSGYSTSPEEAFEKYLGYGALAFVPKENLTIDQGIELIHGIGGKVYLAHLNQTRLSNEDLYMLLQKLKKLGLDGIEGTYYEYTEQQHKDYVRMARGLDLKLSAGSDFHGDNKPNKMGRDGQNQRMPYSVLEKIRMTDKER